jgi:hypothetical protein
MTMTKKDMINEIYKEYYEYRFLVGFYTEGSAAWNQERAERYESLVGRYEIVTTALERIASRLNASPLLKNWYYEAFNHGFSAKSVDECIIPDNLVDAD